MQGIEQIAYQNACAVAISSAEGTGVPHSVVRNEDGKLDVRVGTAQDLGDVLYTAEPQEG